MDNKTDDTADIARANARDPMPWMTIAIAVIAVSAILIGVLYLT